MAYAEKRGDGPYPWRSRYKAPDGTWPSVPGFATEQAAIDHGLEQEADIRRGRWTDPRRSRTPLCEWAATWLAAVQAHNPAQRTRSGRIRTLSRLLPHFGDMPLAEITWWEVQKWAGACTNAPDTIRDDITFLSTILTAAVDARMIDTNPLAGRRLPGKRGRAKEKVWPTPEQAFAVAERFDGMLRVLLHTVYWTGMRRGELMGLRRENCGLLRRDTVDGRLFTRRVIRIDGHNGQLIEDYDETLRETVRFLGPPKPPNGAREIDLPKFLADMIDTHLSVWPHDHPFCRPEGDWWYSATLDDQWQPAADGREAVGAWHGRPAREAWDPILPGLTLHGFRHGHNTLMVEEGVPEVLRCDRLGHEQPGIQGVYSHPSPRMRRDLLEMLTRRYETAAGKRRTGLRAAR